MSVAVIYGGTRSNGNTEQLTERVIGEMEAEKILLKDYDIKPIEDYRHHEAGFPKVEDDYKQLIDRMLSHDVVIFATPIYWYGMSGTLKNFIDRWSQSMKEYPNFKKKMSEMQTYIVAVGGDAPFIKGLPLVQQFHYIFSFAGASFEGYVLGEGNKPGEILQDKQALVAAEQMQKKIKKQMMLALE
ncbi:flavodoxin family protein [Halobacillus naozhouensis]|uniref:Flavodoxin family protein n=1 Tax=Halobacillus naozhouensis TaxID=554880 RepID=A0ABY8J3I0_9BACI|nr:flavodoxin family protein [Halobacillus naozhouensis]WFT75491.1 flavodoxin family protein [Halobacillus naozhouensis]